MKRFLIIYCLLLSLLLSGCKTIYNNYREYLKDSELAQEILNEAGIELSARAETCTMEDFIRLKGVQDEKKSLR